MVSLYGGVWIAGVLYALARGRLRRLSPAVWLWFIYPVVHSAMREVEIQARARLASPQAVQLYSNLQTENRGN